MKLAESNMLRTPHHIFSQMLDTYAGSAFSAAGYQLTSDAMQQARGLFRYSKSLGSDITAHVEYQLLYYQDGPSRFRVSLLRNSGPAPRANTTYADRVEITLSRLMWEVFHIQQPASPDHWWSFRDSQELAHAVVDSGKLVLAFGLPWLEGTLTPDQLMDS